MWNSLGSFYASKEYRTLRRQLLIEREYKCEKCGDEILKDLSNLKAHHVIELTIANVNDYSISLNPKNIEITCSRCHNIEHGRALHVEKKVYLIYGPPLSGKTTYVAHRATRGDLIVDMDLLYQAISGRRMYDKPMPVTSMVFAIHDLLIDKIATRTGNWYTAWIIGGYADKYKRDQMIQRTGAEPILFECSKEECLRRLTLTDRGEQWQQYISKWFETNAMTSPPT